MKDPLTYNELLEENQLLKDLLIRSCKTAQLKTNQVDDLLKIIQHLSHKLPADKTETFILIS